MISGNTLIVFHPNLDLPDAVDFRKQYIPDSPRSKSIAKSVFDLSWFDEIDFTPQRGIFFIMGGLIYYFKEEEIE